MAWLRLFRIDSKNNVDILFEFVFFQKYLTKHKILIIKLINEYFLHIREIFNVRDVVYIYFQTNLKFLEGFLFL